jgi:hypothetical protein
MLYYNGARSRVDSGLVLQNMPNVVGHGKMAQLQLWWLFGIHRLASLSLGSVCISAAAR